MKKVILFIDGSNFYYGLKSVFDDSKELSNFNFKKLGEILSGDEELLRVFYYNAPLDFKENPKKYSKQQKFFDRIRNTEKVKLILCRLQKRKIKGTNKFYYVVKGDDIHIAVDMIKLAYNDAYDTAILVSGDGDFVPAVKAVQEKGKRVEHAYFKIGYSWHLKQTCDKSILIDKKLIEKCFEIKNEKLAKKK